MKKYISIALCLVLAFALIAGCAAPAAQTPPEPAVTPEPAAPTPAPVAEPPAFTAGSYTVDTQGLNAPMQVVVVMSETGIDSIDVPVHAETIGIGDIAIAKVSERIVAAQSTDVDGISGATFTSGVLKRAVNDALAQAGGSADMLQSVVLPDEGTAYVDGNADMVVIGAGAAGMAAAIRAKELGLNVVLLEKMDIVGGTSVMAGVGTQSGNSALQNAKDDPYTADEFFEYLKGIGVGVEETIQTVAPMREDFARTIAYNSGAMIDWLGEIGLELTTADHAMMHSLVSKEKGLFGEQLVRALTGQLEKNSVDYRLANKAVEIVMQDGAVAGVRVETKAGEYTIHTGSVVICTGSYGGGEEALREFVPARLGYTSTEAVSGTGDGLFLAKAAGASFANLGAITFRTIAYGADNVGGGIGLWNAPAAGAILVNEEAKRFVNETGSDQSVALAVQAQTGGSAYVIMDQTAMDARFDIATLYIPGAYDTIFTKADTLEELAQKTGLDAAALQETVSAYGNYVKNESDEEFGRTTFMLSAMTTGPFYACKGKPANHICGGGIRTDGDARVLAEDDSPIPGLYAAGETVDIGYHPLCASMTMGLHVAQVIKDSAE